MKNTIKSALAAIALSTAAPMALAQGEPAMAATDSPAVLTANVKGMVCDFCARAVTKVFSKEDAVQAVDVDLDEGAIKVTLKPGKTLSDDQVSKLVKKSGYALVSVDRPSA